MNNVLCRHGIVFFLFFTALGGFFSGCASLSYNAATGRREFIFIPTDAEVRMGRDIHEQILSQYRLSTNAVQTARVKHIGERLAQVSDRQDYEYNFYLLEKDELNAFTTPGGNIYFFTGLLNKLPSDEAVAAVLAHEIGHCAARHTIKKFQAAIGYQLIGDLVLNSLSSEEQVRRIAALSSNTVMNLVFSAYGRQDEYDADRLGLKYMSLAGFGLNGMIQTLDTLERESKTDNVPLFLRTHPLTQDRITAVKQEIERIEKEEKANP